MSPPPSDQINTNVLHRHLNRARQESADSLERLSSGQVFTRNDPKPTDRALAESLELKLRSLASTKRNINDAVSLLQVAEGGFSEINHILTRMKEINIAAASSTSTDQERRYLLIEYDALHQEIDRIANTTEFNQIPILNGRDSRTPPELIFRVGDPQLGDSGRGQDWNELRLERLNDVVATTDGLGLRSIARQLRGSRGISLRQAEDLMRPQNRRQFDSVYDEALSQLHEYRAGFGAIQNRLQHALTYQEVVEENISAAKSKIADTDYAREVAKLARSQIVTQASTALLSQANFNANLALSLVNNVVR